jgi:hypothetical protein
MPSAHAAHPRHNTDSAPLRRDCRNADVTPPWQLRPMGAFSSYRTCGTAEAVPFQFRARACRQVSTKQGEVPGDAILC